MARRLARAAAIPLAVILGLACFPAWAMVPAADIKTSGPPMGLMLQIGSWSDDGGTGLTDWLNYICSKHGPNSGIGAVNSLVVMNVATPDASVSLLSPGATTANDALATTQLAELLPYFPGGDGPCQFPTVYVGTVDFAPTFPGDIYREGIENSTVRANMVARDKRVAQNFSAYVRASNEPNVSWDWYVTQEAFLDYFTTSNATASGALLSSGSIGASEASTLEQDYKAYLVAHTAALSSVESGRRFLWSPGFVQPKSALFGAGGGNQSLLDSNLIDLFSDYAQQVSSIDPVPGGGSPLVLDMQDHVALEGWSPLSVTNPSLCPGKMNPADAVGWYKELLADGAPGLQMNVEQFRSNTPFRCGSGDTSPPGYSSALTAREQYYSVNDVTLGPSFDLGRWGRTNRGNWGLWNPTEFVNTTAAPGAGSLVGSNVVSGTLKTIDGTPLTGANVSLLQCDSTGGSCEQPADPTKHPEFVATSDSLGRVSIPEPSVVGTSYWRLSVADKTDNKNPDNPNPGWLASESPLVSTAVANSSAWASVAATPASANGSSSVTGVLSASNGSSTWSLQGVSIRAYQCYSSADCSVGPDGQTPAAPVGAAATSGSDGSVSVSTGALSSLPAFIQLRYQGDATHSYAFGPIQTVQAATGFANVAAAAAAQGGSSTVTGKLTLTGGGPVPGATVQLLTCANAYGCATGSPVGSPVTTGSDGSFTLPTGTLSQVPAYFAIQFAGSTSNGAATSQVITVSGATGWAWTSASPAPAGGTSTVLGELYLSGSSGAIGDGAISGAGVTLNSCASATVCSSPSQLGAIKYTGSDGMVSMSTPPLTSVPTWVEWNWPGNSNYAASTSSIMTIQAQTNLNTITASPAGVGGSSTVAANLAVSGTGSGAVPVSGAQVKLWSCPGPSSCVNGVQIGTGNTGSDGRISIATGTLNAVPAYFQMQWLGNANYGPATSAIVTLPGATAWSAVAATAALSGGTSTITSTINVQGGGPLSGASIHLYSCASPSVGSDGRCQSGTDTGQSVVTGSDGKVTFTTPATSSFPTYYQLSWAGNGLYAGSQSSVAAVQASTSWSATGAAPVAEGSSSTVTGTLVINKAGGGAVGGAAGVPVTLYSCPTATSCDGGTQVSNAGSTGTGTTDANGVVNIPTGPLSSAPAYYQLQTPGTVADAAPASSPIIRVAANTAWSSMSATKAPTGGTSTVTGVLAIAGGSGSAATISGQSVQLYACPSATDCSTGSALGSATTTSANGTATVTTPTLSTVPAYVQWRYAGSTTAGYVGSSSNILTVQAQTAITSVAATGAGAGSASSITGRLLVANSSGGGAGLSGASVQLYSCPNTSGCLPGTTGVSAVGSLVTTGSNGAFTVSTGNLTAVPASFAVGYGGSSAAGMAATTSSIVTVLGQSGWTSISATPASAGATAAVSGTLTGSNGTTNGSPIPSTSVALETCDNPASSTTVVGGQTCSNPSQLGSSQTTNSSGTAAMTTPTLNSVPTWVRWNWPGDVIHMPSTSNVMTIQANTTFSTITATPLDQNGSATVTATIKVAGSGPGAVPISGATVGLWTCPTDTCSSRTQIGSAISGADGSVSIPTGALPSVPTFVFTLWAGNPNYGPVASSVVEIAGTTAWNTPAATPAPVGGTSTITAALNVQGGTMVAGEPVHLISCPNATTPANGSLCSGGTDTGKTALTSSGGAVTFTTGTLSNVPAYFQMEWLGDGNYTASNSAIAVVAGASSLGTPSASPAPTGYDVTDTLSVQGAGGLYGANVNLVKCPTASNCSGGTAVGTGTTAGYSGTVTINTGPLTSHPAYYQLQWPGNTNYASSNSAIFSVQ